MNDIKFQLGEEVKVDGYEGDWKITDRYESPLLKELAYEVECNGVSIKPIQGCYLEYTHNQALKFKQRLIELEG